MTHSLGFAACTTRNLVARGTGVNTSCACGQRHRVLPMGGCAQTLPAAAFTFGPTDTSACEESQACQGHDSTASCTSGSGYLSGYFSGPSFAISVTSTAKQRAKTGVGKPLQGGYRAFRRSGRSTPHPSHTYSMPTLRNLAGIPPGVNHLCKPRHANGLHRLVTLVRRNKRSNPEWICRETTIVRMANKAASAENLLFCAP
jgi:hypothetical protein